MLRPIMTVEMHNYPSGDDYWFGIYTYQGFIQGGILGALKGSFKMITEIYETWQGTWFTLFLFTLSPQNFNAHSYFVTVFISLIGLGVAEFVIIRRYLLIEYGFSKETVLSLFFIVFYLSIQYIPRTTSGIFWFNGVMHYTIPFMIAMGCIGSTRLILKSHDEKKHIFSWILVVLGMVALGGSNYLAAIIGLMGVVYEILRSYADKRHNTSNNSVKNYVFFLLAIMFEFFGLFISYKSPGNSIRANDDMSFRARYFWQCIWWSVDRCRI